MSREMLTKTVHKVTEGKEDSIGNWIRGYLCYILVKNFPTFGQCAQTEAKFKGDEFINLAKEMSRQDNIWSVAENLLADFQPDLVWELGT